jgi:hypothetical protein
MCGLLAGCLTGPQVNSATAPSYTSSAVAVDIGPARSPVAPPASEREAFAAANKAVNDDLATVFLVLQRKIPAEAYDRFETGEYRTTMGNTINDYYESTIHVDSETYGLDSVAGEIPTWTPNVAASTSSTLLVGAQSYRYGEVRLMGCLRDNRVFRFVVHVEPGEATPTPMPTPVTANPADTLVPTKVTVTYQPADGVWLITDETVLPGRFTASLCPEG